MPRRLSIRSIRLPGDGPMNAAFVAVGVVVVVVVGCNDTAGVVTVVNVAFL